MKTADFDFDLPSDLIATHPARPRDSARLLDVGDRCHDRRVSDLPDLLRAGDVLVYNDTRVIPAQLTGRRGDARVEITLHKPEDDGVWLAFARPAKRLQVGDRIGFAEDFGATVTDKDGGEVRLDFAMAPSDMTDALRRYGRMPLPPYIRRPGGPEPSDAADYQTMFAAVDGAVAAPTAGLHFTPALLDAIRTRGVAIVPVTLHVGAGTFLPVKVEDVREHRMHAEYGVVSKASADAINAARAAGGRVLAVGTTALRILETAAETTGRLGPFAGDTDIFITPGYRFKIVDLLLTNFHLPRSTLFMLVCAFAGTERMRAAYAHAMAERYRFYSYGDASLLRRAT